MVLSIDVQFYNHGISCNVCCCYCFYCYTMIDTIYLDMDGVFCDFDSRWHEVFGRSPKESRANKEFSADWDSFILTNQFASLPWHKTGKQLFEYVLKLPSTIRIEMLTSSGGKKYHAEVSAQKTIWLCNNGFPWKANVVAGRSLKKDYANPNSIIIDDTFDVIEAFNAANGHGIWHQDIDATLETLDKLLSN